MKLSIQPLIDLANTDRELQAFIYSKSQLEKQIDTASSVVNQHKKTIDEKIDERLWEKFTDMNNALNDPWPDVLDYDGSRKDIPKNEAQKDYTSLVDHLKELREKEDGS